jgi:hypothetical protein
MAGFSKSDSYKCTTFLIFLFCTLLVCFLWGCGGGISEPQSSENVSPASTDTGEASFNIQWYAANAVRASDMVHQAIVDCETTGLASITCQVYDEGEQRLIASGGPWDCSDHQGRIEQIPAGSNRVFAILGWSEAEGTGNIVYQGQIAGITINPGEIANVGTIDAYPFVPQLSGPADEEEVDINDFTLAWNSVANAARYRVQVSDDASFAAPLINAHSSEPTYRPSGLAPLTTYYWRVTALDNHENEGVASAARQFTTTEVHNQAPTATISAPGDHSTFSHGELISFYGSGNDPEEDALSGRSLVWSSSINGRIGTGTSLGTRYLSAGTHTITLTVTNSDGAIDSAAIIIEITNIIDVNIDFDFEYIEGGVPMGLSTGETVAPDWDDAQVESLVEPDYGGVLSQYYYYFTMGNSQDTTVSIVLNTNHDNIFEFYVDSNNNEDLTDDGGPIDNQGQGLDVLFAAPVSLTTDVVTDSITVSRPYRLWFWLDDNYDVRFYSLCHYTAQLVIGGQSYTAVAFEGQNHDEDQNHDVLYKENGLYIDLNGDETLDEETEYFEDGSQLSIDNIDYLLQLNYP